MNNIARIYRAEILRAAFGPGAAPAQAADLNRLNQIAERLAECEEVHGILRAKGHGRPGTTIVDSARQVPSNSPQVMKDLFRPVYSAKPAAFQEWKTYSAEEIARFFRIPPEMLNPE